MNAPLVHRQRTKGERAVFRERIRIAPHADTLVIFPSQRMAHQALRSGLPVWLVGSLPGYVLDGNLVLYTAYSMLCILKTIQQDNGVAPAETQLTVSVATAEIRASEENKHQDARRQGGCGKRHRRTRSWKRPRNQEKSVSLPKVVPTKGNSKVFCIWMWCHDEPVVLDFPAKVQELGSPSRGSVMFVVCDVCVCVLQKGL